MKNSMLYLGFFTWFCLVFIGNTALWETRWECVLVSFAALLIVPQGLALLIPSFSNQKNEQILLYLSSLLLGVGYIKDAGGWLSLPYLGIVSWFFLRETLVFWRKKQFLSENIVTLFALGYLMTGALWASSFLFRVSPLGFDAVIVSLTAAHFHLAGFTLTVVIRELLAHTISFWRKILITTAVTGMSLVALGITLTKLQVGISVEWMSSLLFGVLALVVAVLQGKMAWQMPIFSAKLALLFSSCCLFFGVSLAILYALRFIYPISWVTIPNMKIWHGTLNTLGFGFFGVYGWRRLKI
jgi:YndJ-like protein